MSFEQSIEEIEQNQRHDLEEIYSLARQAKEVQPLLLPEARRYNNYVDGFIHTESESCDVENLNAASESFIEHESAYLVELVERHEALLEDVRNAADDLHYCNNNRYIDGEVVRKEKLRDELTDIVENYEEDFEEIMDICSRIVADESITDPFEIKSKRSRRKLRKENSFNLLDHGESTVELFAD